MQTQTVPYEHVRGTTMQFTIWARRGKDLIDPTDPRYTLHFTIADIDTMATIIERRTGSADIVTDGVEKMWRVTIDAAYSRQATLPKDRYWVEAFVIDSGPPERVWSVGRGPIKLLPSPRG